MTKNNTGRKITTKMISQGAIIAALYIVLAIIEFSFAYGQIQIRLSEALCMTILYTPAGVWGMIIGCLVFNMINPKGMIVDVIFGTLATAIASFLTVPIAKQIEKKNGLRISVKNCLLIPVPTVVVNALIIPFVLYYGYGFRDFFSVTSKWGVLGLYSLSVAAGEIISCYVFGPLIVNVMNLIKEKGYL